MRAIIVDDESNNIENLQLLLRQHCPEVTIIGTATDTTEAESIIGNIQPDIIFLDIQMPDRNGLELLRDLGNYSFEVVFVTGFDKYAIQAIKFAALDYLLKPINIAELQIAVRNASRRFLDRKQNDQLKNLITLFEQGKNDLKDKISLPSLKETRFVKVADIYYCESQNNYTNFLLLNNEKILVSKPIYEYEELLRNYGFIRCHNSYLVNKLHIKSILKTDGGALLLENDVIIPIARSKKDLVKSSFL